MSTVAAALAASSAAQTQASLATIMVKQNHEAQAGLIAVIEQAVEAAKSQTAPGVGEVVDVSA